MKYLTMNIPFHDVMLVEALEIFEPMFNNVSNDTNMCGEGRLYESLKKLRSPLTSAVYSIRLIKKMNGFGQWYARGIQMEFSPPLVTVGNDHFIINDPDLSGNVAQLLIMNFAKVCGLPSSSVLYFDMANAELVSATISLLVPFSSHAEATTSIERLCNRTEALHYLDWQVKYRTKDKPLPFYGNPQDGFHIFRNNGYHLHFYSIGDFNEPESSDSNADALTHEKSQMKIPSGYIDVAKCYAKFDLTLTRDWFNDSGYSYKHIFKHECGNFNYELQKIVEKIFALNIKFRTTIISAGKLSEYDDFVQSLLKAYFAGKNVRQISGIGDLMDDDEYQEIRRLMLIDFRVDISVPWNVHQKILVEDVEKQLHFTEDFKLNHKYRWFIFSENAATKFLIELRRLVK